jgi:hypothetical protein
MTSISQNAIRSGFFVISGRNSTEIEGELGLLKKMRLLRRCAPRNDTGCVFRSLQTTRRIARQSQTLFGDFFNGPEFHYYLKKQSQFAKGQNERKVSYNKGL